MSIRQIVNKESLYRQSFHAWWTGIQRTRQGIVLDIGGSKIPQSQYHRMAQELGFNGVLEVNNLSASVGADYVCDAAQLPMGSDRYDEVWAFNVLEHVEDPQKVIKEMYRVLKPNGIGYGVMPFIHAIHGEPSDYWRMSDMALEKVFTETGFTSIKIIPLNVGPFVMASAIVQFYLPGFIFIIVYLISKLIDRILFTIKPDWLGRWPLGYVWKIVK